MESRWVSFDCFGTMVDWHSGFAGALRPIAGDRTNELLAAYHRHEAAIELERPHRPYKEVLTSAVARAAVEIGLSVESKQAASLVEAWESMPVFPDVEPALEKLRTEGFRLAVLTNCDDDLFARTHQNFRHRFDLVVTAEQVMDYKPAASHFRRFYRATGVSMANWVHVACSWFHDIAPAQSLGVKRIWVDRDRTGQTADADTMKRTNLKELAEPVRELMATPIANGASLGV